MDVNAARERAQQITRLVYPYYDPDALALAQDVLALADALDAHREALRALHEYCRTVDIDAAYYMGGVDTRALAADDPNGAS